jgi:nitrite reductase/ring-hydroxylating ferredoxin subunit
MQMPEQRRYPPFADSRVPHVGTYRRVLPVSLERLYENALDWAHLPYVHASSFAEIRLEDAGPWGWRANVTTSRGHPLRLELRLDRECRRWITRTLAGASAGSEIWTHAFAVAPRRTDIVVDFFVPGVAASARDKVGTAFGDTYQRLYDEDVEMMSERQRQLDRRVDPERVGESLRLGAEAALTFPLTAEFGGRSYVVTRVDGALLAHVARCPHQLGPLEAALDGVVRCPWHGYRFDARSGACLTGQPCRLPRGPDVNVRDGVVWLER